MSGKLKGIPALNTSPLNNKFCKAMSSKKDSICGNCYSINMLKTFRKMCDAPFQRYGEFLSKKVHPSEYLPKPPNALYVRFSAHGELINLNHTINLFKICGLSPNTTFTLWTKRTNVINKVIKKFGKPDNLILIYSNPLVGAIMKEPPEYFDRTFNNVPEDKHVELQNCTGQKCMDCMLCYTKGNGVTTIVEKVKSYGKKVANPKNICKACYSMTMLKTFRKNCVPAFRRNSILFASEPLRPEQIPTINAAYVRISGHGELIDRSDLGRM